MGMRRCSIVTLASLLMLACLASAWAQDWPQWRGPGRDGKVVGFVAPAQWPTELKQVWKVTVGPGDSTPALVGNRLYVFARQGEEEVTLCLNADDGKEVWRNAYTAQAVTGPASRHPGPRGSPAVAQGKVVTLGACGVLSCLDAATGKVVWRKDPFPGVVPQFFTGMSPMIVDGMVIAYLGGAGNGALMAYDLDTGNVRWQWAAEGPAYGSPVLMTVAGTRQVVTLTEKSLVGVSLADGKLLWQIPSVPQRMAYNACTPVVDGQVVLFSAAGQGMKAIAVEKQGDGFVAKELWNNPDGVVQFSSPVLKDGLLYGFSARNRLFCINARTGQTAWVDETPRGGRGGFAAIVDAGSVLMVMPNGPDLFVFKPSDAGYQEVAKFTVSGPETYAHPVVSGKRLFIRDRETVALWAFP